MNLLSVMACTAWIYLVYVYFRWRHDQRVSARWLRIVACVRVARRLHREAVLLRRMWEAESEAIMESQDYVSRLIARDYSG